MQAVNTFYGGLTACFFVLDKLELTTYKVTSSLSRSYHTPTPALGFFAAVDN
jgi:hypothetical protein